MVPLKSMVGVPTSTLNDLQAVCLQTMTGTLQVGQSYTIGERHYQLVDLQYTASLLAAINYAIRLATGQSRNRIFPNFSGRRYWRF
jgi:hypothetical protein